MKIYIDENLPPHLAEGLDVLQKPLKEDIEVLSIKKAFGPGAKDEEWIPIVGQEGGVIITQDFRIQRSKVQNQLYKNYDLGIFFLVPPSKNGYTYWEMVEQTIKRWKDIKRLISKSKRPFAYRCTSRSDFEKL